MKLEEFKKRYKRQLEASEPAGGSDGRRFNSDRPHHFSCSKILTFQRVFLEISLSFVVIFLTCIDLVSPK